MYVDDKLSSILLPQGTLLIVFYFLQVSCEGLQLHADSDVSRVRIYGTESDGGSDSTPPAAAGQADWPPRGRRGHHGLVNDIPEIVE